jgi:hypothetical protein
VRTRGNVQNNVFIGGEFENIDTAYDFGEGASGNWVVNPKHRDTRGEQENTKYQRDAEGPTQEAIENFKKEQKSLEAGAEPSEDEQEKPEDRRT